MRDESTATVLTRGVRSFARANARRTNARRLMKSEAHFFTHAFTVHFLLNSSKGSLAGSGNKKTRAMEGDDAKWENLKKKKKKKPNVNAARRRPSSASRRVRTNLLEDQNHKCGES